MKRRIRAVLLAMFCLVLVGPAAYAQLDDNQIRLMAAGDATDYPGEDVLVVYDSTDVDVQDSGLSYVRMRKLVKVLTEEGARSMRHVIFDYDPLSAAVEVLRVRIYRTGGQVEAVSLDKVVDYAAPARAIYWGARQKMAPVGWLEVGDAVEIVAFRKGFTYALLRDEDDDSRFVPPMKGHFYEIVEFWSSMPVMEKVYRVLVPENKPLQYEVYNGEVGSYVHFHPRFDHRVPVQVNPAGAQHATPEDALHPTYGMYTKPGKITYCWFKRDITPLKREPDMVAPSDVAPKLLMSTSPDWYAKSTWFYGVNEDFGSFEVTPEVQDMTDELLDGVDDELEKIAVLNHWVAEEIRYSGISMGEGEGYTLHTGEMTFSDRCGVCKDKAGMLVTMLRAAGFESYPAMTMAGSRIDRIPADQFNHSVTVVKRSSGEWMLLDPTWIPGAREMWSSAEQQQEYLLGIPGGADVMTTPISPAENHYWKATNTATLAPDGTLTGTVIIEAEGQSDALMRRAFTRSHRSAWEDVYSQLLAAEYPGAELVSEHNTGIYDLSVPLKVTLEYRIPDFARVTGNTFRLTPLLMKNPFGDYYHAPELSTSTSMERRSYGFRQRCSRLVELEETITLPAAMNAEATPRDNLIMGEPASFRSHVRVEGNQLKFGATHRMEKRVYEAADWPVFRAALKARKDLSAFPVTLSK
jgi:transglutaminase-like putative cysteine protease